MVIVNDILDFTNRTYKDIKKLNLNTYGIESILNIDGIPEDIVSDGSKVIEIDIRPRIKRRNLSKNGTCKKFNISFCVFKIWTYRQ